MPTRSCTAATADEFLFLRHQPIVGRPTAFEAAAAAAATPGGATGSAPAPGALPPPIGAGGAQMNMPPGTERAPPNPPKFAVSGPTPPEAYSSQASIDTLTRGIGRATSRAAALHEMEEKFYAVLLGVTSIVLLGLAVGGEHCVAAIYRR
eukprot:CAMPEP_0117577286 /NCGR_PEP_ID=MMETSP0784-20121206/63330_1 /TAXON_ID=39447 /ORGANISM="" /LENGTH=149 /DNA_ID=CAMNT_0005376755 /DNA_START=37 /DNA_END=482 /DNA_ORIENTATION=+